MTTIMRRLYIDAPPEKVYDYMLDPDVTYGGTRMEVVHRTPEGVADVIAWTWKTAGLAFKGVMVITELEPHTRIVFRMLGGIESKVVWTLEPEKGGTRFIAKIDFSIPIPLLGRLLAPFVVREMDKNLARGKADLEAQATPVSAGV